MLSRAASKGKVVAGLVHRTLPKASIVRATTVTPQQAVFSTNKSWIPISNDKLQEVTMNALILQVADHQRELAMQVVPWFLRNMPAAYFRQVPESVRSQHIKAVTVLRDLMQSELSLKIETKHEDTLQQTYFNSETKAGVLHQQIKSLKLPKDHELTNVNVFSSLDGKLALNVFSFEKIGGHRDLASLEDAKHIIEYVNALKAGKHAHHPHAPKYSEALFSEAGLEDYVKRASKHYVQHSDARRFLIHRELYEKVRNSDAATVRIEPHKSDLQNASWVTIAAANVLPEVILRLCSGVISARGLDIARAHLDVVDNPETTSAGIKGNVVMLRLLVSPLEGVSDLNTNAQFADSLSSDLKRIKWLDNSTTELGLTRHPQLGLNKAEVITALCSFLHGPLFKINSNTYASINTIIQLLEGEKKRIDIADSIATLFLDRFNPANPLSDKDFQARSHDIRAQIKTVLFDGAAVLLDKMLDTVHATLRTNFYNSERYALSLRLKPSIMVPADKAQPFGLIFSHGRNFNAFHNRFRDIARGGLRIVTPKNSDQYALESSRQFDEVYGLSYAQQLKNKDIPEGGSKAVVLVNTPIIDPELRFYAMRKSVKAFVDSLLDLIVVDSVKNLVDFYGKDELIYLGPDEQVIPSDIDWITQRAAERGYPLPAAFMSSKADAGFNHKEFGVTSEGVVVYLDVALRNVLKIDPHKNPFTVKVTGGPDGDVAGNLIRILFRDYPNTAKIVGVADGFGVAEDPNGLDKDELLRLVDKTLSIDQFNKDKLSKDGIVMKADTEEGATRRNSMHNRVISDVFVPAGGRPETVNGGNWKQFLLPNGKPSSPLIVEGANIFNTKEAREHLFKEAGVTIVKDSSANKCGVVTSSCEVQASMLLSKQEFMSIKPELVEDVLKHLRELARLEGELLFRAYNNYPGDLPHFSERISLAIAKVTDALTDYLQDFGPDDAVFQELFPLIEENLPKKLRDFAGDRIRTKFPVQYQRNAIASNLASKLVYKEGIHLIESQPIEKIAQRALIYYRAERQIQKLVAEIDAMNIPDDKKENIKSLIAKGGSRTLLNIF